MKAQFRTLACLSLLLHGIALGRGASAQTLSLKGSVRGGAGYTVILLSKDGSSKTQTLASNGAFKFSGVSSASLKQASLQLVGADGRYFGPVVLGKKGKKVSISFSGKTATGSRVIKVGAVSIKDGYGVAARLDPATYLAPRIATDSSGRPVGAGNLGIIVEANRTASFTSSVSLAAPGEDSDRDGVVNTFDADDNGNGILDAADVASAGAEMPYVGLHFDMRRTLNAHVRDGLSAAAIDSMVAGENVFTSIFFISLPNGSSVDGGHLVCTDPLSYCRRSDPLGYSSGVSESTPAFRAPLRDLLNSAGYPVMEKISVGGNEAVVLSLQPRVGRDVFRAGDLYRVVLTSGSTEVSSKTFTLPPYFVSVPALKDYSVGGVTTTIDYRAINESSGSIPGVSPSDPIVLGPDGLWTVRFWRPQREPVGEETGYRDFGGLNYGVVIENAQATCAGLYSNISPELAEDPAALGDGGSVFAGSGANLTPLTDTIPDRLTSVDNLLSFTVDLRTCLARSGGSAGTYAVTLSAAGIQLTGGRNTANQAVYVTIP